jgi:predicted transcriptional regulator
MRYRQRRRRDRIELRFEILRFCQDEKPSTQILQAVRFDWPRLQRHLGYLLAEGLLAATPNPTPHKTPKVLYTTTDKGREILKGSLSLLRLVK